MSVELDPGTIERARRGDRSAREAVLRRYAGPLYALARRAAPGDDADDLAQDLLRRLLENLPRFDPNGPAQFSTWVFAVAHHHLVDVSRRRRLALAPLEAGLDVPDRDPGADRIAAGRSELRLLEAAIARLPEVQRRVFVLVAVHGQALEAVAETEGVPVGTVKSRLHRARAALARDLGPGFGGGEG
jgi:RNA polymerase sigma-70 factor (ECF subfamily)